MDFKLINRPDFWAAAVGFVAVIALALFGVEIDQEAILGGILGIVAIFTGSQAMSEYRDKRLEEEKVKAAAEIEKAKEATKQAQLWGPIEGPIE